MVNAAKPPKPSTLNGNYCILEPLNVDHAADLFEATCDENAQNRHKYLFETVPENVAELREWIELTNRQQHAMYFATIDKSSGRCGGRQAFLRIRPEHASIEIGSILWGQGIARTRIATEALYLTASHIFEGLGYQRFEWKCNNLNQASKSAAIRFGFKFEGVFRKDLIIKAASRDTAWYSMLASEWLQLKPRYQRWLDPDNFDENALAKTSLAISHS